MGTLTVQMVTRDNEATVARAIRSAKELDAKVVVADLGSQDRTREVCRQLGAEVLAAQDGPRHLIRNRLADRAGTDMILTLEPWEAVVSGHAVLVSAAAASRPTRLMVASGGMVSKPVRLWDRRTQRFAQPVFEAVQPDADAGLCEAVAYSNGPPPGDAELRLARQWAADDPVSGDPEYCEAFCHLAAGRTDEFMRLTDTFLFKAGQKGGMTALSARYHRAWVCCYNRKNPQQALTELLVCASASPLHAEYWCLLGDVYYHLVRDFRRASEHYRNARLLGRHRDQADPWPIQPAKYDEYPDAMEHACQRAMSHDRMIRTGIAPT